MNEASVTTASPEAAMAAETKASNADAGAQPASQRPALADLRQWWMVHVIGQVDQAEVTEKRREDSAMSEHYLFMTAMSGGIAILGLLLSSPAVVIGAMLLSPLMGPIMGLGFALAIADWDWIKQSLRTLVIGSVAAVLLCAALVYLSPIQTITSEIAARTRPNLFDLFVALFSALAGAYAMIRGREGAIVGVAIATALMPPIAVVGFGLATYNWTVFSGALLLFVTNLLTIALTAFALAKAYGFRNSMSARNTMFQNIVLLALFIGLTVPLAFSLQQIAWETNAQRIARDEIRNMFERPAQLDVVEIDFAANPVTVSAIVFTPEIRPNAETAIARALTERLGKPVELLLTQSQTASGAGAAQRAQLSATRSQEDDAAVTRMQALSTRLALVAGVSESDVLIDRNRRRALVRAKRLDGAELATYRALEVRIAAGEPDWTIELIPPPGALPGAITFDDGEPTDAGQAALAVTGWAAQRLGRGVELIGPAAQAEAVAEALRGQGIAVNLRTASGPLRPEWAEEEE